MLAMSVLVVCCACAGGTTSEEVSQPSTTEHTVLEPPTENGKRSTTTDSPMTTDEPVGVETERPVVTTTTSVVTTTSTQLPLEKELPSFEDAPAPERPFTGLVQLWYLPYAERKGWRLRYWSWDTPADEYAQVLLPDLQVECLGRIAMVADDEHGIEIGGPEGTTNSAFVVPWGGTAQKTGAPSDKLLEWATQRPSNITVRTEGDLVHVNTSIQQHSYAMRDPVRPDGDRWTVQARHDGELFLLTVHPAHLPCYSGVTWVSLAETGEFVTCGANTAATLFVAPEPPAGELILPDPDTMGTYLSCAPELNLELLPFTKSRQLTR